MGDKLLDGLARALAKPMPRRRVVRLVGAAIVVAMVPGGRSRPARAASTAQPCGPDHRTCPILENLAPADWCCPGGSPARRYRCDGDYYNPHCSDTCGGPDDIPCPSTKKDKDGFSYFKCCSRKIHSGCKDGECVSEVCGPNITKALGFAMAEVGHEFAGWSAVERGLLCGHLYSIGPIAWDIAELDPANRRRFIREQAPKECRTCGDPEVVQVGNECHHAGSVNYVVFGAMMRLCRDNFKGTGFGRWFDRVAMDLLIVLHKTDLETGVPAGNLEGSLAWANAGFSGWPLKGRVPGGDRPKCKATCGTPYSGPQLTVRWSYRRIRYPR